MYAKAQKQGLQRGFSMMEIIIVMAILSVIAVAVTVIVNPVERLRRARDAQRLADVRALADAVSFMESDISGGVATFDYDGPAYAMDDSCAGDANPRIFVSVPSDNGEADPTDPPGWTYERVLEADLYDTTGNGWVPVDFTANTASPIERLPVDPTNTFASGLYYMYVCGSSFEVNAALESSEFAEETASDGGDSANLFEAGSGLTSAPERAVPPMANVPPDVTMLSDNGPVDVNDDITFTVDWTDPDDSVVTIYVCKAGGLNAMKTGCASGGWTQSAGVTASSHQLMYTTVTADVATSPNEYYVYVCDDEISCDGANMGTFTTNSGGAMGDTGLQYADADPIQAPPFCSAPTSGGQPWISDDEPPATNSNVVRCQPSVGTSPVVVYDGFNLSSAVSSTTIDGIVVLLDDVSVESNFSGNQQLEIRLSWDGGTSWTSPVCRTNDLTFTPFVGEDHFCSGTTTTTTSDPGLGLLWARTWTPGELSASNFRVEVKATSDDVAAGQWIRYDTVQVRVHYTN